MAENQKKGMPYVRLGKSGLKVSKIILGCMSYANSERQGSGLSEVEGIEQIKYAYDAGIQTFDTANVFANAHSEVVLGKAIKQHNLPRDEIVVMTKVFLPVNSTQGDPSSEGTGYGDQHGLSRKRIFESIKHSLERLQLDYVDVLQCPRFDPDAPVAETMQALHDIVQAGYARYIGMGSCWAWQFHVMQNYAIAHGLTPFISMQNHYSLLYREEEREMMPTLKHFGVGSTPWAPLARGLLIRPRSQQTKPNDPDAWLSLDGSTKIIDTVEKLAQNKGVSMAQISLAWVMAKDPVTAPIVGTTNIQNLEHLIGSINISFAPEEIKQLEDPYTHRPISGHV